MNGLDLKNHHALLSSIHIKELFEPVLNSIGITYFNYIKIYHNDCSRELLTNYPEWIYHFYKNELFNSVGAVDVEHLLPKGYFLWSELNFKDPIYLQGRDFFNIDNGVSFVVRRDGVTHLYIFASTKENFAINMFYLSNIDLLQRFIHYFNDKAESLIQEATNHRIYLPTKQMINSSRKINQIVVSEDTRRKFIADTRITRYFLFNSSDDLYLTQKQAECAKFLIKGYTSKYIAKEMCISHRTVEGYLLTIKNKLQQALQKPLTKQQVIKILQSSNIS